MDDQLYQLVLASSSPRRKELLAYTYLDFDIIKSDVPEHTDLIKPEEIVVDLARLKAHDILHHHCVDYPHPLVLGADTIVVRDDVVLGKPVDQQEAKSILLSLSGRKHHVYTGVYLASRFKQMSFYEKTEVEFSHISQDLLERYLATGESMDKAGAYGIQSYSLGFVKGVQGSYSNVVGLPVCRLMQELESFVAPKGIYESFSSHK
ncbi:MAG: septum formation protein Maf [Halobacteriovoraceae bacterium]|nr:septum formation protein Maf [Halobacteriovoraceae bacterium]